MQAISTFQKISSFKRRMLDHRSQNLVTIKNHKGPKFSEGILSSIAHNIAPESKRVEETEKIHSAAIMGDVLNHLDYKSSVTQKETSTTTESFEEARFNLATRIMSNGVEVIIAGDKNKPLDYSFENSNSFEYLRTNVTEIDHHQMKKPMTLAPSTLKNQMVLVVPTALKEKFPIPIHTNQFVTKTCLTTYTYRTTYLQDGRTRVESREKIIANIATEERNYPKISSFLSMGVTLSRTPQLAVGVFPTTYSYFFTLSDGENLKTLSTGHTVINTITAPEDYIFFLQPSEAATPVLDTNTYFNKVVVSKTTGDDGGVLKVLTGSETLTQVVVTESLPAKSTSVLTSYYAFDVDETQTQVFSTHTPQSSIKAGNDIEVPNKIHYDIHVYATKSVPTTLKYNPSAAPFKQELQILSNNYSKVSPSHIASNFHTRVLENVISEAIPTSLLNPDLVEKFHKQLKRSKNQRSIVTMATLLSGQTLEITAMKMIKSDVDYSTSELSNTKNTATSILSQLPERTVGNSIQFNPSRVQDVVSKPANQDYDYGSNELRPAAIKIDTEKNSNSKNATRLKVEVENNSPSPTYMNNIFSSINLKGLTVLRPVFNVMADLLQSKLISNANMTESKNNYKNITSNMQQINQKNPIYIPFQNAFENDQIYFRHEANKSAYSNVTNNFDILRLAPPQTLHIGPPQADLTVSDDSWAQGNYKTETFYTHANSLLKNPSQQPLLNGGIPIRPGEIITANSDVIIGKPNGIQQPKLFAIQSNIIPLRRDNYDEHPKPVAYFENQQKPSRRKHVTENYDNLLKPPPPPPQSLTVKKRPTHVHYTESLKPIYPFRISNFGEKTNNHQEQNSKKPYLHRNTLSKTPNPNESSNNNEIKDSKRIPNIFSTRFLPEGEITPASNVFLHGRLRNPEPQNQLQLQSNLSYLNSTSFSESRPKISDFKEDDKNFKHINKIPSKIYQNYEAGVSLTPIRAPPHSNHQRISLQTNVLSHNIAINAPPIIFTKESDISTPVLHGIPSNFDQLVMPHINIPANEVEVHVNLTPQNSISLFHKHSNDGVIMPSSGAHRVHGDGTQSQATTSKSNQRGGILASIQNRQSFQSTPNKYLYVDNNLIPNTTISPAGKIVKTPSVLKSHFVLKPAVIVQSAYNNGNESEDKFKTRDQTGAFSLSKHTHFPSPLHEQLNKQFKSAESNNKGIPNSLLDSLTALQVNNLHEATYQSTQASSPHSVEKLSTSATAFETKADKNTDLLPDLKQQETHISATRRKNPSPYFKANDTSNKTIFSRIAKPDIDFKTPTTERNKGQPFTQNFLAPETSSKITSLTSEFPNLFIANGEGFKFNIKPTAAKKSSTHKIKTASQLAITNRESIRTGDKRDPTLLSETQEPWKEKTSRLKENMDSVSERFDISSYRNNQNFELHLTSGSGSTFYLEIPHATQTIGLYPPPPPPQILSFSKNSSLRNVFYKTIDPLSITSPRLQTQFISKTYIKLKSDDGITDQNISFNPPSKSFEISTPTRKDSTLRKEHSKSSSSIQMSRMNKPSNNFMNSQRIMKMTAVSMTQLPKVSQLESPVVPFDSDNFRQTQILKTNLDQNALVFHQENVNSKNYSQIVLEPSIDNLSSVLMSSNDYLPSASVNNSVLTTESEVFDTAVESNFSKNNETMPLEQIVEITKFITNTVTTTKTTISGSTKNENEELQSSFKTLTFFLSTTFTTAIVDTFTEVRTVVEQTSTSKFSTSSVSVPNSQQRGSLEISKQTNQLPYEKVKNVSSQKPVAVNDQNVYNKRVESERSLEQGVVVKSEPSYQFTDQDNIFIVMSNIQGHNVPNTMATHHPTIFHEEDDYNYANNIEFAERDEEVFGGSEVKVNNILLGGVLIATSTISDISFVKTQDRVSSMGTASVSVSAKTVASITTECHPVCKTSRNELCKKSESGKQCVCRPGFARMFPDRPCRPTYSYTMRIAVRRIGDHQLVFNSSLSDNSSKEFRELAAITRDSIDRMVMQSDLRDVYHGVSVEPFTFGETKDDLIANIILQFSDMNDEKRLEDVFKKYLRISEYNIGLTELFSDKKGVETISIFDFNECDNPNFHDCSENARCFNRKGTYTCNCNVGYIDRSANSAFPGRSCTAEIIGCERCNFHGSCAPIPSSNVKETSIVCECFPWYSGSMCQLNLKVLLIALIAIGTILFVILLICILLTCMRRPHPRKSFVGSVISEAQNQRCSHAGLIGVKVHLKGKDTGANFLKILNPQKRAMIIDTSSESSDSSLPYDTFSRNDRKKYNYSSNENIDRKDGEYDANDPPKNSHPRNFSTANNIHCYIDAGSKSVLPPLENFEGSLLAEIEQSDRSLTVMIPRAKYHPSVLPQTKLLHHQLTFERINHTVPQKIPENQSVSGSGEKHTRIMRDNSSSGALVSAGFEVSAMVNENTLHSINENSSAVLITREHNTCSFNASGDSLSNSHDGFQYDFSKINKDNLNNEIENHAFYNICTLKESTCGKTLGDSANIFTSGSKSDHNTNEEANTMAERDIGSTFLLPHTHLYKPERESELSGLDSL